MQLSAQTSQEWFDKAMQQLMAKQYAEAVESCNKALELNPDFADAYIRRGAIYYYMKEFDKTIADCTKGLALNGQPEKAYYNRGLAYYQKGDYPTALPDLRKVTELNAPLVKDNAFFYAAYG